MSIYITQQQKEEWEAKITDLEGKRAKLPIYMTHLYAGYGTEMSIYREILSKATVLPVETEWDIDRLANYYPNGVIVDPK